MRNFLLTWFFLFLMFMVGSLVSDYQNESKYHTLEKNMNKLQYTIDLMKANCDCKAIIFVEGEGK